MHFPIFSDDYYTPDGTGLRDYIYMVDLAWAHFTALEYAARTTGARPFNVGIGDSYSEQQLDWTAIYGLVDMTASAWAWQSANLDGYGTH